jgi:hypothetical protein
MCSSPSTLVSRCISATRAALGSVAPTRTPTACSANTSPRAPTCASSIRHAIAAELNGRPRQTLAFKTPSQALAEALHSPPETASVSATAASPLGTYGIGRAATRSTLPPATAAVTTSRVRSTAARDALEWPRWRRIPTQSAQVGLANSLANAVAGSGPRGRSVAGRCLSCWFGVEPPAGIEPATPSLPSMVGPFGGQRGTSLRSIEQQVAGRIDDREMGVLRGGMRRGCWQITGTHADHSWASQGQVATMQTAANCQGFWCEQSLQVRLGGSSSQSEKAHSAVPEWRGHGC